MEDHFSRSELKNRKLDEFRPTGPVVAQHDFPEEYDDENEEAATLFERFRLIAPIIFIAIICFVSYAWYTDKFTISRNNSQDLLVIKANKEPLREKPEDPGGMKIINRDKRVYDAISGKDNDKSTSDTNILPAPEEPIAHENIAKKNPASPELINQLSSNNLAIPNSAPSPEDDINNKLGVNPASTSKDSNTADNIAAPAPAPATPSPVATTAAPAPKAEATIANTREVKIEKTDVIETPPAKKEVAGETPQQPVKVKEVTAADITDVTLKSKAPEPKKVKKTEAGYRIQLGSYRSEGDASSSLKAMRKKFPDILHDLNDYIEKADLGDKGIYYRLQLSGFSNESDARKVCQKLTIQKQGCFFVGK